MKLLLVGVMTVLGCGGSPEALFASPAKGDADAVDNAVSGGDVAQVDAVDVGTDVVPPVDSGAAGGPDADPALEGGAKEASSDALGEVVADVAVADAPPGLDACPCYRNMAMDSHCTEERPEAWVCQTQCGLPGCTYDYQPQPGLACCPGADGG